MKRKTSKHSRRQPCGGCKFDNHTETAILETLIDQSPLHVLDIAKTIDCHPITVDRTCAHLHDQGYINPCRQGLYELTEHGKRRIRGGCNS